MRKITWIFFFLTFYLNASCSIESELLIKELEKKYKSEISGKDFKPKYNPRPEIKCEDIRFKDETLFLLPYLEVDKSEPNSDYYYLSLVIALVDSKNNELKASFFHKNIAHSEDTYFISKLNIVTNIYQYPIGLEVVKEGASRVYIQWDKRLFLYKKKEKILDLMLSDFLHESLEALYDLENDESKKEIFSIASPRKTTLKHPPLIFNHRYEYTYKEKSWNVDLEPVAFVFKNGKYERNIKNVKKLFDLKEVENNTKKGLRYKTIVLSAMTSEIYMNYKNVKSYNNIAYYLQKAGHNNEAIYLLQKIIEEFPKRTAAYYNLADAYWALGKKKEARTMYEVYVKQRKSEGLSVPKKVLGRLK